MENAQGETAIRENAGLRISRPVCGESTAEGDERETQARREIRTRLAIARELQGGLGIVTDRAASFPAAECGAGASVASSRQRVFAARRSATDEVG